MSNPYPLGTSSQSTSFFPSDKLYFMSPIAESFTYGVRIDCLLLSTRHAELHIILSLSVNIPFLVVVCFLSVS